MTQITTTQPSRGEAFWRQALLAHRKSGLTQVEYCRRNDLAVSTFQYWRRRLQEVDVSTDLDPSPQVAGFVELAVRSPAGDRAPAEGFELIFPNGLQLKVPSQVEGRALGEVLWALEVTGSC